MASLQGFFQSRSRSTFAALVRDHQEAVYRTALRICGDPATAEDVTQDVFLRLLTQEPKEVRSTGAYLAWQAVAGARRSLRRKQAKSPQRKLPTSSATARTVSATACRWKPLPSLPAPNSWSACKTN